MKKTFFISGRQTGKTTNAIFEFLKNPEETLFISYDDKNISRILNNYKNNCISQHKDILQFIRGRRFNKIIIDEYLYFKIKNQIKLYNDIRYLKINFYGIEELFIFSSPNKIINNLIFNTIKNTKNYNYDIFINVLTLQLSNNSKIDLLKFFLKKIITLEEYYYLCNSFLTDSDINIINDNISNPRMFSRNVLSESEIFGKYLNNKSLFNEINKEIIKGLITPVYK
jgi:hypothetical protein